MAAQKGKDLLLKIDAGGNGVFTTIAGLRARTLTFSNTTIDITNQESTGQWRELLEAAGERHASVTGAGIFKDSASDEMLREAFFGGAVKTYQIAIPAFGIVQGAFLITTLVFSGRHDNELGFDIALESAGQLAFTAV